MDVVAAHTRPGPRDAVPAAGAESADPGLSRAAIVRLWALVVGFGLIAALRSAQVDVPFRDPHGALVAVRVVNTVVLTLGFAATRALWTSLRRERALGAGLRGLPATLRRQWPWRRMGAVAMAAVVYHLVYLSYRNLKSWVAFRSAGGDRDHALMALDRALFGGHTPAAVLHDLFGQHAAALVFADIYDAFPKLVTLSVAAVPVLVVPVARSYLFVASMMWVWVLGTATYYLVPSLGPFATYPQYFAGLTHTAVSASQDSYLVQRDQLLAHPGASDAYASISAFASLHTGVTCVIMLMAYRYGRRLLAGALAVYLAAVMVATIYVGMHFVVDDVAGIAIAIAAVWLGRLTVGTAVDPLRSGVRTAATTTPSAGGAP